jgi:hypothetical protein
METEQIMAQMFAEMKAELRTGLDEMVARQEAVIQSNQEKTDTNLKEIRAGQENLKEGMRAGQELLKEEMLAKMEINQERMDGKSDAHYENVMVRMDSQLQKMEACLRKTKVMNLEANPEEIESEEEHEVLKKQVTVETFGALKEQ